MCLPRFHLFKESERRQQPDLISLEISLCSLSMLEREALLRLTKGSGSLVYSGAKVLVLLDLPQEILLRRKALKPVTDQLK